MAPDVQKAVEGLGVGKIRARCKAKEKLCVVEFNRVASDKGREIIGKLSSAGFKVLSASVNSKGPKTFATEVRIKR